MSLTQALQKKRRDDAVKESIRILEEYFELEENNNAQ